MKKLLFSIAFLFPLLLFAQVASYNIGGTTTNIGGAVLIPSNLTVSGTTKGNNLVNRYAVGANGKFTTLKAAADWFNASATANTEFLLDGGTFSIADSITINNPNYHLNIRGLNFDCTALQSATGLTGKPMFNIYSEVFFERITFDGSTLGSYGTLEAENCLNIKGNDLLIYVNNYKITGFHAGIYITGGSDVICTNGIFENSHDAIKSFSTDTTSIDIEITNVINCNHGIHLAKGVFSDFFINSVVFYNVAADTSIFYEPATYTYNGISNITSNTWNFLGKFMVGFDFENARDANIFVKNNVGIEDKVPHAKINVINNLTTTTCTTATNFYKVNYTNGSVYKCKFTLADNKATYQPTKSNDIKIWVSGNIQVNNNTRIIDVALVKNAGRGTSPVLVNNACLYSPMSCRLPSQNVPYPFSLVAYVPDVALNDYFELWITSANSGDLVIVQDLTIYIEAN
jgi:hypothetical protein